MLINMEYFGYALFRLMPEVSKITCAKPVKLAERVLKINKGDEE